jgi:hypothetical protein
MPTSPERRWPPGAHKLAGVPESSRGPRRFLAATGVVALAGGLAAGLAGCSKFDAALGQQWATVNFNANTPVTTILEVRAACSHIPNVRAEALPPRAQRTLANMMYAVTYRTDNASDANLAQLQQCLQRYPAVAGIDFEDSGADGG